MTSNKGKEKSKKSTQKSMKGSSATPLETFVPLLPPDDNENKKITKAKKKRERAVEAQQTGKPKKRSKKEKKTIVEVPGPKADSKKPKKSTHKKQGKKESTEQGKSQGEQKREKKAKQVEDRGVVYLGHLPYGFVEEGMRGFFSQFGDITRLKVSRNKQGKSKHYAFIEFKEKEVAAIVAEAMDNYLLFGRRLKCELVNPERLHPGTFVAKKFFKLPWKEIAKKQHNKVRTAAQQEHRTKKLLAKEADRRKVLADLGIEYHFSGYKAQAVAKPKVYKLD